jgi:hypothetical protein
MRRFDMARTLIRLVVVGAMVWPLGALATPPNAMPNAVPNDLELETQRAAAAEAQNAYLIMLLQRQKAKDEATAAWWGEVWKALPVAPQQMGEAR